MSDVEKHAHTHNGTHGSNGAGPAGSYQAENQYSQQVGFPPSHRKFANPAPLGLFSFASTTLILSFYNIQARGVHVPNVVVGMALGVGGLVQLLAGMWEFACGNTFGATAFSSYGGFWLSFALIYIPGAGILEAFAGDAKSQLHNAVAIYLMSWFIFTFIMFMASHRSSIGLAALFFFLDLTFMLLMIGEFMEKVNITKAGGGFGILTAAIAYYVGAAGLWTKEVSYVQLPVVDLSKRNA